MIGIACPGQGSQAPGFLDPWLELAEFKESIDTSSEILGIDLIHFGTVADAEEIRDTQIAQPLIVAAGIASFTSLQQRLGDKLSIASVAGHSVGEITAAWVAGILNQEAALQFVNKRGQEMALAAALQSSSMAAVVGGEPEAVLEYLADFDLTAANYNGKGQIVAAGASEKIARLTENPPAGTRVVGLQVAGAFHTSFMEPAKAPLAEFAQTLTVANPRMLIWTNADGSRVDSGAEFLELLVNQVSNPVRWDKTMDSMVSAGVDVLIELLPGGTLSGIAKRSMPNTVAIAIKTPDDLDKVAEVLGK